MFGLTQCPNILLGFTGSALVLCACWFGFLLESRWPLVALLAFVSLVIFYSGESMEFHP